MPRLGVLGVPPEVVGLGIVTGVAYGLTALVLVLVLRTTRVVNLALAQIGTTGALVLAELHEAGVPYWPALLLGAGAGAAVAALTHLLVAERLRELPPVVTLVATLGVARLLVELAGVIGDPTAPGVPFVGPPGLPAFDLGALHLSPARIGLLVAAPLVAIGVSLLLSRTADGRGALAAGDDRELALGLGVPVLRTALVVSAAAGAIASLAAALSLPGGGLPTAEALGPGMLLRALTAAALGGFTRPGVALAGGMVVGVVEQVTIYRVEEPAFVTLLLLGIVVVALAVRRRPTGRRVRPGAWMRVVATGEGGHAGVAAGVLVGAAVLTATLDGDSLTTLGRVAALGVVAVSAWVLACLAGQVSFAQVAVAGLGAAGAAGIASAVGSGAAGLLAAAPCGALAGVVVAALARGDRELGPPVVTLGVAIVAFGPLLRQDWALGDGVAPARLAGGDRTAAVAAVAGLALAVGVASWVRRRPLGRAAIAARDNEPAARGLGVPVTRDRIALAALAGALAGVGGALLAQSAGTVRADLFPITTGIDVVAAAVVGGLSSPAGALLGATVVLGLPALAGEGEGALLVSSALWLVVLLVRPAGLVSLVPARRRTTRQRPALPAAAPATPAPAALELRGVSRRFGGVVALPETSLSVAPGEAVAVTGANGAGKTTLLEVAAGAEVPDTGTVLLDGRDVTVLGSGSPSRAGVVHLVQDPEVFPTLHAREAVQVGAPRGRDLAGRVAAALDAVGAGHLADRRIATLSTGERRRVALAAALAAEARLLLVDEPSAGVAGPDRPQLAALLADAARRSTLVLVDHDAAMLDAVASRVVVLGEPAAAAPALGPPSRRPPVGAVALEARDLVVTLGGTRVLGGVDLELHDGELVLLRGANGAGKSTLLRALAGMVDHGGTVLLGGEDVSGRGPTARARAGLRTLLAGPGFASMRAQTALAVAADHRYGPDPGPWGDRDRLRGALVRGLSGGERQVLRLAQATASAGRVVLVDEVSLGLDAARREGARDALLALRTAGVAVLATDQDDRLAAVADRVLVVEDGALR